MYILGNSSFQLAKVSMIRPGCPVEMASTKANLSQDGPILIVKNSEKKGAVRSTGYTPTAIVIAGAAKRAMLLDNGIVCSWAFVEAGAININADDEISCNELMEKLNTSLVERFYGRNQPVTGQPWPYIVETYPFENYFIYVIKGQKYRQAYDLDPVERRVALRGGSVAVQEKFVNAEVDVMPRVQTGVRYAYAPVKGQDQSSTRGARNSELVTQVIRNWADVLEAVAMYLDYTRSTNRSIKPPMQPSFYPVDLTPGGKIRAMLAAKGIDVFDFAKWSAAAQLQATERKTKSHGGTEVPMSKHAYVGNSKDPSTWKLPIDTPGRAQNALARVNQTHGIPSSAKAGVLNKIRKAASRKGVGVSEKPTSGQKKWAASALTTSLGV